MKASEVRKLAPRCTSFAQELRDVFGDVKIERLSENGVQLGKPDDHVYASCLYGSDGWPLEGGLDALLELAEQG